MVVIDFEGELVGIRFGGTTSFDETVDI